jgi:hypothetical protein
LSKSANLAYAELSLNYSNYTKTTDKLQNGEVKSGISRLLTTATTEEWPNDVIEEIGRMFDYIQSCQNPQDISYEGYLKNGVVSVVTVVSEREIAIPEKSPVVLPSLPCSLEVDPVVRKESSTIEADLRRAEEERLKKEEHFREVAEKYRWANGGEGDSSFSACSESTKPIEEEPAKVNIPERIRAAAISEYGMAGWVDPAKLAHALKLPLIEVEAWLLAHYVAYQRPGGGTGYRQRRAGEAKA